jgi:signal transduction histidine kinase
VGRANELVEVVQTLLDNARDHAPRSSVVVRAQREGDRILVRVEDRGPGVAPSSRDRIFQRGVTSSRTGSGLGLYVARRLVREQGGDLWLEDRLGGGSSFVVSLPAPSPVLRCVPSAELVDEPNHARQSAHPDPLDAFGGEQ